MFDSLDSRARIIQLKYRSLRLKKICAILYSDKLLSLQHVRLVQYKFWNIRGHERARPKTYRSTGKNIHEPEGKLWLDWSKISF
jgi:hypothetical protein